MTVVMKKRFRDLVKRCERLRSPRGCPWDREQTLETLKSYIIEEAYEVTDAIDSGEQEELIEELGDLLYQIVFASQICKEDGLFSIDGVIEALYNKLIRRHPHVFGDEKAKDAGEALIRWHGQKLKEKSRTRGLLGVPRSMPSLLRAQRVGEKASHVGFDWSSLTDVIDKVKEELDELQIEIESGEKDLIEKEWGDLVFSLVNLARHLKIDAEGTLHKATDVFIGRFNRIEEKTKERDKTLSELTLKEMDELWEEVKKEG